MKVLVLLTSARANANSSALGRAVAEGAAAAGADVDVVDAGRLDVGPCTGCDGCRRDPARAECVQRDAMDELYPKVLAADALVFAGPIYFFTFAAQTKAILDRLYAVSPGNEAFAGKAVAAAFAYGGDDPLDSGAVNAIRALQDTCAYAGAAWKGAVYASALGAGALAGDAAKLDEARALGATLVASDDV